MEIFPPHAKIKKKGKKHENEEKEIGRLKIIILMLKLSMTGS